MILFKSVAWNEILKMNRTKNHNGFTLTEVLISVLLLGILASAFTVPFISGAQSLVVQADRMLLDSRLRSEMEVLISRPFIDVLTEGSHTGTVTVSGETLPFEWDAVLIDLDGDSNPEPNAMQITVEVGGHTLTTIVVDNERRIGKIS